MRRKRPCVMWPCMISLRPIQRNMAMATAPMVSMSGELMDWMRTLRRLARKRRLAAFLKRRISHNSVLKAFTMRLPVTVSCRMFWIFGQLVLAGAGAGADFAADLARGRDDHGNEQHQRPAQVSAQLDHQSNGDHESEELLEKIADDRTHRGLHAIDVVDERGKDGAGGMLVEEARRAAQRGFVEMIAQVGDRAEAGIVHQVGAEIVAQALEQRGQQRGQRPRHPTHCACAGNAEPGSSDRNAIGFAEGPAGWGLRARRASTWSKMGCSRRMRKASRTPTIADNTTPGSHSSV